MASYRLIDELPGAAKRRPPFSPRGLFFLSILFLPVAAPFWVINWGRLGHPKKRFSAAVWALAALVLPFVFFALAPAQADSARLFNTLAKLSYAYFQLYTQRPFYDLHLVRGGQKAPAWPLWAAALFGLGLLLTWQFSD